MDQTLKYLQQMTRFFVCAVLIFVFFRWLLVPLLPFLLALALCAMLEPPIQRLSRRYKLSRGFAASAIITALLLLVGGLLFLLFLQLVVEVQEWSTRLPSLLESLPSFWNQLLDRLNQWYRACPPFARSLLDRTAQALSTESASLLRTAGGFLMDFGSDFAAALPGAGLFIVTSILAIYFTGFHYPGILSFLKRQLPRAWQPRCRQATICFRTTVFKWIRSELLLISVTFLVVLLGFLWMRLDYALLGAVCVALVDALPVLGNGTILLPWAAVSLLLGNSVTAVRLLLLYATVTVTHTLLEPRLLAGQVNLPPITALLAMYLGFHLMGVGGMILFPVLMLLLKQLEDAKVLHLWR